MWYNIYLLGTKFISIVFTRFISNCSWSTSITCRIRFLHNWKIFIIFFPKFIFAAFRHCVPSLRAIRHDKPEKLIATYKNEIMKMFDQVWKMKSIRMKKIRFHLVFSSRIIQNNWRWSSLFMSCTSWSRRSKCIQSQF
jgi:hypothetical protein